MSAANSGGGDGGSQDGSRHTTPVPEPVPIKNKKLKEQLAENKGEIEELKALVAQLQHDVDHKRAMPGRAQLEKFLDSLYGDEEELAAMQHKRRKGPSPFNNKRKADEAGPSGTHREKDYSKYECHSCGEMGHIAKKCKNKGKQPAKSPRKNGKN